MNGQHITVYTRHLRDVREMAERYEKGEISKDEYLAAITNAIKNDVQTEMRVDVSDKPQQLETKDFPADFDFAYHRLVVMPDGRVVSMNDGVEINGVTWALTNVDWSGTFAARPEDFGGYYKHSEAKCPEGWRLPTIREINSLAASGSRWTTVNGVTGREYGSGANTIFLPAAGRATIKWEKPHKWVIRYVTTDGFYWTSTRTGAGGAHDLLFNEGFSGHQPGQGLDGGGVIQRRNGLSVRCVKQ